jgi:hypothetical protein
MFLTGVEIDKLYRWPLGRAERLARRKKLPHSVLPDGAIRFDPVKVAALVKEVDAVPSREAAPC